MWGKVGSKENWDSKEQKLLDIIFQFSTIVCFIWFKEPRVSIVSCIEASKSIKYSSFGSTDLQVLMAGDVVSIPVLGELGLII